MRLERAYDMPDLPSSCWHARKKRSKPERSSLEKSSRRMARHSRAVYVMTRCGVSYSCSHGCPCGSCRKVSGRGGLVVPSYLRGYCTDWVGILCHSHRLHRYSRLAQLLRCGRVYLPTNILFPQPVFPRLTIQFANLRVHIS